MISPPTNGAAPEWQIDGGAVPSCSKPDENGLVAIAKWQDRPSGFPGQP